MHIRIVLHNDTLNDTPVELWIYFMDILHLQLLLFALQFVKTVKILYY